MPPTCWPDPGISIGLRCQSLDPLGRYKCWNLREKSPAHHVWKIVSKEITALLDDQFEHLDTRGSEFMVEMFMIGKKPAKASPTILFSCESKSARQRAMELVQKKSLLGDHPGVRMAHCSRLPRPLALIDKLESLHLLEGIYAHEPLGVCTLSILVIDKDYALPRRATIGGFFSINNAYYGLTTAHAFREIEQKAPEQKVAVDIDLEFSFYDETIDDSSDEDDDLEMTSKGSVSSLSSRSGIVSVDAEEFERKEVDSVISRLDSIEYHQAIQQDNESLAPHDSHQSESPVRIGEVYAMSSPDSGLDWALVKIDFDKLLSASMTFDQTNEKASMKQRICAIVNNILPNKMSIRHSAPEATDSDVLIRTASYSSPKIGTLSAANSWTRKSEGKKFQELLKVRLERGSFADGDCGSWVVDSQSGWVYGHVISGYPESGVAYIVPAWQIITDIEGQLQPRSHVGFPLLQMPANTESLFSVKTQGTTPSHAKKMLEIHTSSKKTSPRPAYVIDADEEGIPISGTRRRSNVVSSRSRKEVGEEKSKPTSKQVYKSEPIKKENGGKHVSGARRSAGHDKRKPRSDSPPTRKSRPPSIPEEISNRRDSDVKLERRRTSSTKPPTKPPSRPSSSQELRDRARLGFRQEDASDYGIQPSPVIGPPYAAQPVPLRPRPFIAQPYPNRPVSYHAPYFNYHSGPPPSAAAYYHQPLMPVPNYPPPSAAAYDHQPLIPNSNYPPPSQPTPYVRCATTPQPNYFPQQPLQVRPLSARFDSGPRPSSNSTMRDSHAHSQAESYRAVPPSPRRSRNLSSRTNDHVASMAQPTYPVSIPAYRNEPQSRIPNRHWDTISYDLGDEAGYVEIANSRNRRQTYHPPPRSPKDKSSKEKTWTEKAREAARYQEDGLGPTTPLTAEALRRQQDRGTERSGESEESRESNPSKDESDCAKSATTVSTVDPDNGPFTIKVSEGARIMVGGIPIDCETGGEITIQRKLDNKKDGNISDTGYESVSKYSNRSTRRDRQGRQRDSSAVGYSPGRKSPQYPTGSYF